MNKPPSGSMIWWRFKSTNPTQFTFGYCSYLSGNLIRLGSYNGDIFGGRVVDYTEIEWRPYVRIN